MKPFNQVLKTGVVFIKNNPDKFKKLTKFVPYVATEGYKGLKILNTHNVEKGNIYIRKSRYNEMKQYLLTNNDIERKTLIKFKLEIQAYVKQIEQENGKVDKLMSTKRAKNWTQLLKHINDDVSARDYHEFIMLHQDPLYTSIYFKGFDKLKSDFINASSSGNKDKLKEFLKRNTKVDILTILNDFDLQ